MDEHSQALADLALIRRLIDRTRRSTEREWMYFATWGVVCIAAAIASHALLIRGSHEAITMTWLAAAVVGFALSAGIGWRRQRTLRVRTFVDRAVGTTWWAVTVVVALLAFGVPSGVVHPSYVPALIAWQIGIGVFVTGGLLEWRPFYYAGALWWLGGILMTFMPRDAFLIEIILLAVGYLLPAYLLRRAVRAQGDDGAAD